VDLTGDGRLDLITGSYPGAISIFRGIEGGFAARVAALGPDGQPLVPGRATAVHAADWDRDGDLDLIIGDIDGKVLLAVREGADRFAAPRLLTARGRDLVTPGGHAGPIVTDWDRDGTPDLLVGCGEGSVLLFHGKGASGAPALERVSLLVRGNGEQPAADGHAMRPKPCVADWDGDGRADLLIGDYEGRVWFYRRVEAR
jgi:hypothetical protein